MACSATNVTVDSRVNKSQNSKDMFNNPFPAHGDLHGGPFGRRDRAPAVGGAPTLARDLPMHPRDRLSIKSNRTLSPRWMLCADARRWISAPVRPPLPRWGDERRAAMVPRSGRVGTIYTSAAEVRGRPRTVHRQGVLFNDIASRSSILEPGREGVKRLDRRERLVCSETFSAGKLAS